MKPTVIATGLTALPASLRVTWNDGIAGEFASIWLRDNLPEDRDAHSGQRLVDVMDIPAEPRIQSARLQADTVTINWQGEARPASIPLAWLHQCATGDRGRPELRVRRWLEAAGLAPQRDFAVLSYAELGGATAARLDWLTRLLQDGIAFLRGVPQREHAILEACAHIG